MKPFESRVPLVCGAALGRISTMHTTEELCLVCVRDGIPGDFVECGVFAGVHPALMEGVATGEGGDRKVHLFDSFEGIPEAGPHDDESITALIGKGDGRLVSTGVSACPIAQVKWNMGQWGCDPNRLVYHHGWFQETVPHAEFPRGIAALRLDGDLYESTMVCLVHLHRRVHRGGFVIIDDYALTGCRAAVDEYRAANGITAELVQIPDGGGPVWYRVPC